MATLRFGRVGRTFLLIHDHRAPAANDWSTYVRAYTDAVKKLGVRALLVVSEGGGPNAAQRRELLTSLRDAIGEKEVNTIKTGICSSSIFARGVTTAITWMLGSDTLRAFDFDARGEAMTYLGVPSPQQEDVLSLAETLFKELTKR